MFTVSGLAGLVLVLGAAVAVAAVFFVRGRPVRLGATVVAGALAFQLIHVFEHGLQVAVWAGDPSARPWMSSWAAGTASGVGQWCSLVATSSGAKPLGTEMLHLLGNVIFVAGLAVMVSLGALVHLGHARKALAIQCLHVLEHVVLTGTLVVTGTAYGASTVLNDVLPVGGATARVLFHFGINAAATFYAVRAVHSAGWRRWVSVIGSLPSRSPAASERFAAVASR